MADWSKLGYEFPEATIPVERGKILELARAFGDDSAIFRDPERARALGYEDVPAPLTFSAVQNHWRDVNFPQALGLDLRRTVHGGCEWEYRKPVVAGDELRLRERVVDISTKQGRSGEMTFIVSEAELVNQRDEVAVVRRNTTIELAPTSGEEGGDE
jgi:acyl dehydratase